MPLEPILKAMRLVLVGPLYAGNVGACARLAANYEIDDLWIVAPQCEWNKGEALLYAKGPAREYLEKFKVVGSLSEALSDCDLAIGFTRRVGEFRRAEVPLTDLAAVTVSSRKTALVFGREDSGLTHEELKLCTEICSFSVGDSMASLNLSHAVAVAVSRLYEDLSHKLNLATSKPQDQASLGALDSLFQHLQQTMLDSRMTPGGNLERTLEHLQRLIQKGRPTENEVAALRAFLSKAQATIGTRKRN